MSTIALIEKQMEEQVSYTSSNQKKSEPNPEAFNLDEDESTETTTKPDNSEPVDPLEPDGPRSHHASTSRGGGSQNARPPAGTLVVCPASVLKQWANELTDKVTEAGKLTTLVYHGGARTRNPEDLTRYDVVITTYTIVTNEVPKQNIKSTNDEEAELKNMERNGVSPEFASNSRKRKPPAANKKKKGKKAKDNDLDLDAGPLSRVRWFRVVLDEAQTIKNHRTQVARACSGLRAKRRWCLSGTPIQNSIDDLFSYFRFLKYEPYSVYSSFCSAIKHPIS